MKKPFLACAIVVGLSVLATACNRPPPTAHQDHRKEHPIDAKWVTFGTDLVLDEESGRLDYASRQRLDKFVREYQRRGRGALTVVTTEGLVDPAPREQAEMMVAELKKYGVSRSSLLFATEEGETAPSTIKLKFPGYAVVVPKCGDWSGNVGFNPSNLPHTNFGCSLQRNIGLMLSDPGDLRGPKPLGAMDATRSEKAISDYRTGAPKGDENANTINFTVQEGGGNK